MGPETLAHVLRPLRDQFKGMEDPDLLVGLAVTDDAAVYRLNNRQAIIQTTDFFPPVVDDPYYFGAIAAANAMSDVYAMGGEVLIALNLVGWPEDLATEILTEILRGGAEKVAEAGGVIGGGHTVTDHEPKYGLAVTGVVHPDRIVTKSRAEPGDALLLTKPLGTGVITTAHKAGEVDDAHLEEAIESMLALNRRAAQLIQEVGVHAATDVTGFGLLGHSHEMATNSGVRLRFIAEDVPFLDGALEYARCEFVPGGTGNNRLHFENKVDLGQRFSDEMLQLFFDPQTSGGLLIAVSGDKRLSLESLLHEQGQSFWLVGEVLEGEGVEVL